MFLITLSRKSLFNPFHLLCHEDIVRYLRNYIFETEAIILLVLNMWPRINNNDKTAFGMLDHPHICMVITTLHIVLFPPVVYGLFNFDMWKFNIINVISCHYETILLWHSAFFIVQLSHPYMTTGKNIALTRWTLLAK